MLAGKVVVVSGAASGLGRAICIAAARHGAKAVIVADLVREPKEGGSSTESEVERLGTTGLFVQTDVTRPDDLTRLVAAASDLGGADAVVCNAGIALPNDGINIQETDYHRLMSINLDGAFFMARSFAEDLRSRAISGSIVFTASMGGLRGSAGTVAYSASKGALRMLSRSLADELGPAGIRVNCVCPGLIDTHLIRSSPAVEAMAEGLRARTPLRRLGRPSEIGEAVAWLCSDYSTFVTAADLIVDGGLTAVV